MKLLVVSSCTGDKAVKTERQLHMEDFGSIDVRKARERELARLMRPARVMYTGEQHVQMMQGIDRLRKRFGHEAVDLRIVSAGYGLIDETTLIAPYDVTFQSMSAGEIDRWAKHLSIAPELRAALGGYPLVVFLLGDKYLRATGPVVPAGPVQRIVLFGSTVRAVSQRSPQVTVVAAGKSECSVYRSGMIALKGLMFNLLAKALAGEGTVLWDAILADCTSSAIEQALKRYAVA